MDIPNLMLGGVPLQLHAGAPAQTYSTVGGWTDVQLSGGALYRMTHFKKQQIGISGTGWLGPGFAGLDFSAPLELRCTHPRAIGGSGPLMRSFVLDSDPRPDVPPWGLAFFASRDEWVECPVQASGRNVTCEPVPGADLYRVCWMPVYQVLCSPPDEALNDMGGFSWSFTAREV